VQELLKSVSLARGGRKALQAPMELARNGYRVLGCQVPAWDPMVTFTSIQQRATFMGQKLMVLGAQLFSILPKGSRDRQGLMALTVLTALMEPQELMALMELTVPQEPMVRRVLTA
jgi:hypothetical protein